VEALSSGHPLIGAAFGAVAGIALGAVETVMAVFFSRIGSIVSMTYVGVCGLWS